jgi:hypothetical protein
MADAERELSTAELNRALLARQMLLERKRLSLPKALERIGGIQAQYAPSMYVGLWTRLEGFEREKLTRALERRTVVQGTLLRATIHLVTPAGWWRFSAAVRRLRRERWLAARKGDPSAKQMEAGTRRLRKRLAEGPVERAEVEELIGQGSRGTNGASIWTDLVRVPPSGTWERRRADLFAEAERWIGPDPGLSEAEAMVEAIRSYLRGFGPANQAEIADWIGVSPTPIATALKRIELRRFRGPGGGELVDLPRAPLPDPENPAPVRFLPVWDATLLAHARRTQILPDEHRSKVFNPRTPQSIATFTVDGAVAGTWRYEKGKVKTEPFGRLDAATRRRVDGEAERLTAFSA